MRSELHPEAEEELFHHAAWYDDQRAGLGDEFLAHVSRWFGVVTAMPDLWPRWPETPDDLPAPIRRVVIDRFPHMIAYQVIDECVLILAVAPAKRAPLYWLRRARR